MLIIYVKKKELQKPYCRAVEWNFEMNMKKKPATTSVRGARASPLSGNWKPNSWESNIPGHQLAIEIPHNQRPNNTALYFSAWQPHLGQLYLGNPITNGASTL